MKFLEIDNFVKENFDKKGEYNFDIFEELYGKKLYEGRTVLPRGFEFEFDWGKTGSGKINNRSG